MLFPGMQGAGRGDGDVSEGGYFSGVHPCSCRKSLGPAPGAGHPRAVAAPSFSRVCLVLGRWGGGSSPRSLRVEPSREETKPARASAPETHPWVRAQTHPRAHRRAQPGVHAPRRTRPRWPAQAGVQARGAACPTPGCMPSAPKPIPALLVSG